MSDDYDGFIDAVQRIAWAKNRYQTSALNAARVRGTLGAEVGRGGSAEEDCCTADKAGTSNDGSNVTDSSGGIPDDYDYGDQLDQLCGLTDCSTGQPVCVNFSGTWVPPDGWDNLKQGEPDPTWTSGMYWWMHHTYVGAAIGASKAATLAESIELGKAALLAVYGGTITGETSTCFTHSSEGTWCGEQLACGGSTASYCTATAEDVTPTTWPDDGVPQLSFQNGQFWGHPNDPDAGNYVYGQDDIYLCDGNGKQVHVVADESGGFMVIPTDPNTGDPVDGAAATRYNADGSRKETVKAEDASRYQLPAQ